MRLAHTINLKVIAKPEEDVPRIRQRLIELVPFDITSEKIQLVERSAEGFTNRKLKIFTITMTNERHTNEFLNNFAAKLSDEQKKLIWAQAETRLDEQNHFFIRIDKDAWLDGKIIITDLGNCYHIETAIAAFPARRENALKTVETILYPAGRP